MTSKFTAEKVKLRRFNIRQLLSENKVLELLLLLLAILLASSAQAQQASEAPREKPYAGSNFFNRMRLDSMVGGMRQRADEIQAELNQMQNRGACGAQSSFAQVFSPLQREINVSVVYGYKDFHPENHEGFVEDKPAKEALVKHLTERCQNDQSLPGSYSACGFTDEGTTNDITSLSKVMPIDNRNVTIRVRLTHSSYTSNHIHNTTFYQSEQKSLSDRTFAFLLDSIRRTDFVLYNGHARAGGGPDPYPSRLLANGKSFNFDYYSNNPYGKRGIERALQERVSAGLPPLPVFALIACRSTELFTPRLAQISPRTTFIGNPGITWWVDEVMTIPATINAVFSRLCTAPAQRTINMPRLDPSSRVIVQPAGRATGV